MLPSNAPSEFRERAKLWNAAEAVEKCKNSQTARSINPVFLSDLSQSIYNKKQLQG